MLTFSERRLLVQTTVLKSYPFPVQVTQLENGLTVITMRMPTRRIRARFVLRAGSMLDGESLGCAHFLEHMVYQGPNRDPIHPQLYQLALHGVDTQARTGQVFMDFEVQGLDEYIGDMLEQAARTTFFFEVSEEAVEQERAIIIQEIRQRMLENRYDQWLLRNFLPNHPSLQHTPGGSEESVQSITAASLEEFHRTWFYASNSVLVVAGNVQHEVVLTHASDLVLPEKKICSTPPCTLLRPEFGRYQYRCDDRPSEVMLYFPRPDNKREDALVEFVCDMLAGSMLSLLILRLRHREQKIYNLGAHTWDSLPLNCLLIEAPAQPELFEEVEQKILEEIHALARGNINPDVYTMVSHQWYEHYETWGWEVSGDDWVDALSESWLNGSLFEDVHRGNVIRDATHADISRVVQQYFCDEYGCVHILPFED
jgi:predicted Zn-dependent peptidase